MDPITVLIIATSAVSLLDTVLGSTLDAKRTKDFKNSQTYNNLIKQVSQTQKDIATGEANLSELYNKISSAIPGVNSIAVKNKILNYVKGLEGQKQQLQKDIAQQNIKLSKTQDAINYATDQTIKGSALGHLGNVNAEYSPFEQTSSGVKKKLVKNTGGLII